MFLQQQALQEKWKFPIIHVVSNNQTAYSL